MRFLQKILASLKQAVEHPVPTSDHLLLPLSREDAEITHLSSHEGESKVERASRHPILLKAARGILSLICIGFSFNILSCPSLGDFFPAKICGILTTAWTSQISHLPQQISVEIYSKQQELLDTTVVDKEGRFCFSKVVSTHPMMQPHYLQFKTQNNKSLKSGLTPVDIKNRYFILIILAFNSEVVSIHTIECGSTANPEKIELCRFVKNADREKEMKSSTSKLKNPEEIK